MLTYLLACWREQRGLQTREGRKEGKKRKGGREGGRGEEATKFTVIKLEIVRAESMLQMTRVFSRCFHLHILLHSHRTFLLLLLPHFSISTCVSVSLSLPVSVSLSFLLSVSRSLSLSLSLSLSRSRVVPQQKRSRWKQCESRAKQNGGNFIVLVNLWEWGSQVSSLKIKLN